MGVVAGDVVARARILDAVSESGSSGSTSSLSSDTSKRPGNQSLEAIDVGFKR